MGEDEWVLVGLSHVLRSGSLGHLEVLQWARTNGCEWDQGTCAGAAYNGHLEVLQWARANGCEWDWQTCINAAYGGHLEVLQWARSNGCEWNKAHVLDQLQGWQAALAWATEQPE